MVATVYLELTTSCCQPQELHSGEHREGASGSAEDGLCWDEAELPAQGPELRVDSHRGNYQPAGARVRVGFGGGHFPGGLYL